MTIPTLALATLGVVEYMSDRASMRAIAGMTVEEWVELDPPVEIVLRRVKDGARIVFVATRDRYAELCNEGGVAVFSPKEVRAVIEAAKHEDAADVMDRVVDVKLAFPGTRFNGFNAPPGEGHTR